MCYYKFSFFVLISVLVANTIAVNVNIPDETWKKFKESAGILCACSRYSFDSSVVCKDRDAYLAMGSERSSSIDEVCENIKKITGLVPPTADKPVVVDDKGEAGTKVVGDGKGEAGTKVVGDGKGEAGTKVVGDGKGEAGTKVVGDGKGEAGTKVVGDGKGETGTKVVGDGKGEAGTKVVGDSKGEAGTKVVGDGKGEAGTKVVIGDKGSPETPAEVDDTIDVKNKTKHKKNTDNDGKAVSPDHLKNDPPKEAKLYSLPTLLAILFCSFGAGIIFAVGGKLAYDRYRKRSYVLPPEQGMQL